MKDDKIEKNVKKIVKLGMKKKSLVIRNLNHKVNVYAALREILFKEIDNGEYKTIAFIASSYAIAAALKEEIKVKYKSRECCDVCEFSNNLLIEILGRSVRIIFLYCFGFYLNTEGNDIDLVISDEPAGYKFNYDNCDNFGYFFDHSNAKKIVVMTEDDDELIDFDCNYVVV